MAPHLTTAQTGPLLELERHFLDHTAEIERWFRLKWQPHRPPFYGSTDLRNAGFKLVPVDLNLFPGGFNNLGDAFLPLCIQAAQAGIERICPNAKKLLLIPENHTRNLFYLQNVARLKTILELTGLEVRVGSLLPDLEKPSELDLGDGSGLLLEPLRRKDDRLVLDGFDPCSVLLNNDLSGGVPPLLKGLNGQCLIPPLHAGWHARRKSNHAAAYDRVAREFAAEIGIDPWRINPAYGICGQVNFHDREGEECLALQVERLLMEIRGKYREYGIDETPFIVMKADAGTYGMGVMTIRDPADVVGLNRRQRNKMSVIKEGVQVSEVILQEGVYTNETVGDAPAEPVVYMMDHYVVGGFYRVNTARGRDENLNAQGMHFEPLLFENTYALPDANQPPDAPTNRIYAYGVIARLALLAASVEIEETAPKTV